MTAAVIFNRGVTFAARWTVAGPPRPPPSLCLPASFSHHTRLAWGMSCRPPKRARATEMAAASGAPPASASSMIDENDFMRINEEMQAYDQKRELVIKKCRDIQKASKNAIFALHRGDRAKANTLMSDALAGAKELAPVIDANPTLRGGSYTSALEEWAEAAIFGHFLEEGKLLPMASMELVNNDEYLGGVLDFTGELNRYAIAKATQRDVGEVQRCRDLVEGLMGMFLQMDLRNGSIRKKYDGLKYTLKKQENTLYELSLTAAGLPKKPEEVEEGAAEE